MILCIAVLAAGVLIGSKAVNSRKTVQDEIAVYVNGSLYLSSPIKPGEDLVVEQEDGSVNVIRMVEGGFFMQSSTCKNQDCIYQGSVTRENWGTRILGTHVICLPNRVDVMLLADSADTEVPDV